MLLVRVCSARAQTRKRLELREPRGHGSGCGQRTLDFILWVMGRDWKVVIKVVIYSDSYFEKDSLCFFIENRW